MTAGTSWNLCDDDAHVFRYGALRINDMGYRNRIGSRPADVPGAGE